MDFSPCLQPAWLGSSEGGNFLIGRVERRLAAVLAADVVGYSSLVERDEARALELLRSCRKELIEPLVSEHRGRVVKLLGDGLICEFASVVDAVSCAASIQQELSRRAVAAHETDAIRLRIGVSLGDLVVEDGELYGDGINIAARLEQMADPGGLLISGAAHDHLHGRLDHSFEDLGEQQLKNIARPVRVFRLRQGALPGAELPNPPLPDRPSVAVLPFANLSGDPEQGYFADGIVEEITTALARIPRLFVVASGSSFTYRERAVEVRRIGRELGVRYVVEGGVRRAGDRVRITGQLVDAQTGAHLWAERFEGALGEVFDLQDRVAEAVAGAVEPTLRKAEIERARRKPTESLDAYDLYLRALPHTYAMTPEDNAEALRLLGRATTLDPRYAAANGLLAWCHEQRCLRGWSEDSGADREAAEAAARRALATADDDTTALALGGFVLSVLAHEHETALDALGRAVQLNPNSALALGFSALVHCFASDYGVAADLARRSLRLSPVDPMRYLPLLALAYADYFSGRFEEGAAHARMMIQASPEFENGYAILIACLVELRRSDEVQATLRRLLAVSPGFCVSRRRRAAWRDVAAFERYLDALRRAGLPD